MCPVHKGRSRAAWKGGKRSAISSQPNQTTSERQETQAPKIGDELFRELFDGVDDSILQEGDAPEEDKRKGLYAIAYYAIAASVFA
jgi:hypothetical protein